MVKRTILALCLITPSVAVSALSPFFQSTAEMKAILSHADTHKRLGTARSIDSITKTPEGYMISSGNCQLSITVKYLHENNHLGPAKFKIEVAKNLICTESLSL